ncbi:MAG: endonuclease/exonuclease/phosphatase family protein [Chloroflexales bacterium]|nr:endonuclease/exonuclease/phosphatase family protein [Chloroflexales bacterium]
MQQRLIRLPLAGGLFLTILTLGSLLGQFYWGFDVLSHFNLQYTAGLGLCMLTGLFLQYRRLSTLVLLPALLVNIAILAPFFLPQASAHPSASTPLRIVSINVFTENEAHDAVIDFIVETNADIVFLSEVEPALMAQLDRILGESYPYVHDESVRGTLGLAFISRHPFIEAQTIPLGGRRRRLITASLNWQGTPVQIYGMHPLPPFNGRWTAQRNGEIETIQKLVQDSPQAVVLLGDFNASPWSYPLRRLNDTTNLRHAGLGYGIWPTWQYGTTLISAPLDHIFVSPEWTVTTYDTSGDVQSDHKPIVADLLLE